MKFSKVRNSDLISKVLFGIILLSFSTLSSFAQYPGYPQAYPIGTGIPGYPAGYPVGQYPGAPQVNPAAPIVDGARVTDFTETDEEIMTHEDSVRTAIELRETEDLNLEVLRRKIFGFKLFNLQTQDPNLVLNIPTPNNYVLGTNDHLIIDVFGYSQEQQEVVVDADGYITLAKAGIVKVNGSTIEEASTAIRSALSRIHTGLSNGRANLKVSLGDVRSIKVTITGEAVAPGTYTVSSMTTVFMALYRSGGPNEIGSFRNIQVIRNNKKVADIDLYDILMNGFSEQNILLKDQDVIQIPPFINRVIVNGSTKREGYFELKPEETLKDAVHYAGGFGPNAYTHRLKVYRNTSREKEIFDVANENISTYKMQTGDSLVVDQVLERFSNLVTVEGAVYRPGQYSLNSNKTIKSLIESADGLMGDALSGRVSLVRTHEDLSVQNISVNYGDILNGESEDIELRREDLIIVPSIFDLTEVAYIRIYGAINNPDAEEGIEIPYIKNLTLEDVLVRVGGLTEGASLSRVEIVRRKKNVNITHANAQISEIIPLTVSPDLQVVSGRKNVILEPFDEIFVRSSPNYQEQTFVEIQGEVFYPSTYGIQSKEERISDIIIRAGGLTLQAYQPGATLIRTIQLTEFEIEERRRTLASLAGDDEDGQVLNLEEVLDTRQESIGIDLESILKNPGSVEDLMLRDDDIIVIPNVLQTIRVQGEVLYPTTVRFVKGSKLKKYVTSSGGFTKNSLKRKTYVIYPNGSVNRTHRLLLLFKFYPKVEPGSEIIVPQKASNTEEQLLRTTTILNALSATISTIFSTYALIALNKQ